MAFGTISTSIILGISEKGRKHTDFSLRVFTQPNTPKQQAYPEGFQGNDIPLDGAAVARLVQQRLTLGVDESD